MAATINLGKIRIFIALLFDVIGVEYILSKTGQWAAIKLGSKCCFCTNPSRI